MKMLRRTEVLLSFFLFLFASIVLADGQTFPPTIIGQPTNDSVAVGGTATFSVTATGTAPLNYYWSFNGANIPGATGSTLTLTNVMTSQAGNYSVFIINDYGSTNSASAKLTVYAPPQFFDGFNGPSLNPIWQANLPDATSGSLGTGAPGTADYIGAPNYTFGLLDSSTVLNVDSVIGPFQRVGWSSSTNFLGSNFRYEARFNTGFLTPATSEDGFLELWIMNATNDNLYFMVSTYEGDSDTVPYVFFGTSEFGFYGANPYAFADNTWYRLALQCLPGQFIHASLCDDNERELFGTDIAAVDGSVFGSGFKIVIAQNVGGDGTNAPTAVAVDYASLTNQFSPAIIDQPQSQVVSEGSDATLNIVAEGPPPLSYQWTFDGTSITDATNATLTITDFQSADAGTYSVTVTNAFGSVISSNALLSIPNFAPMILNQPKDESVPAGATAAFSVTVTGSLPLNYFWSFNNVNIPGATNSTLTITNVALSRAGNYSVFIFNDYGTTNSASGTLTVIRNPRLAIVSSSGTLHISWPTNSTGFVLVTTTNLLSGNWVPVTTSPVVSSNRFVVPIVPSGSDAFYRLQFSGN